MESGKCSAVQSGMNETRRSHDNTGVQKKQWEESDMKKIVVEIDGVRHRLVGDNSNKRFSCEKECSLYEVCKPLDDCIADDFIELVPYKSHFEKEEENV